MLVADLVNVIGSLSCKITNFDCEKQFIKKSEKAIKAVGKTQGNFTNTN